MSSGCSDEHFDAAVDLVKGLAKTLKPDWTAAASLLHIDEPVFWVDGFSFARALSHAGVSVSSGEAARWVCSSVLGDGHRLNRVRY